jgi:hypothetical protein
MRVNDLDEPALQFELKIRNLPVTNNYQKDQRELRKAIRAENEQKKTVIPHPPLDPDNEATEIEVYLGALIDKAGRDGFPKAGKEYEELYSQLCHVEGRIQYVNWRMTGAHKDLEARFLKLTEDLRTKHFSQKMPYINMGELEKDEDGNPVVFTEEQEKELQRLSDQFRKLLARKDQLKPREKTRDIIVDQTVPKTRTRKDSNVNRSSSNYGKLKCSQNSLQKGATSIDGNRWPLGTWILRLATITCQTTIFNHESHSHSSTNRFSLDSSTARRTTSGVRTHSRFTNGDSSSTEKRTVTSLRSLKTSRTWQWRSRRPRTSLCEGSAYCCQEERWTGIASTGTNSRSGNCSSSG